MTVKELITRLLEEDMNNEVKIVLLEKHTDENGVESAGYHFNIDEVAHWNHMAELVFTDYRKENE